MSNIVARFGEKITQNFIIWLVLGCYLNFFVTVSRIAHMIADVDFELSCARKAPQIRCHFLRQWWSSFTDACITFTFIQYGARVLVRLIIQRIFFVFYTKSLVVVIVVVVVIFIFICQSGKCKIWRKWENEREDTVFVIIISLVSHKWKRQCLLQQWKSTNKILCPWSNLKISSWMSESWIVRVELWELNKMNIVWWCSHFSHRYPYILFKSDYTIKGLQRMYSRANSI